MTARTPRRKVDGVVLLDKPLGLSSNHALLRVRRLFQAESAGHTGTLDPLATGLLPIALGEATKFSQGLLESDKRYRATVRLGITTSTGDAEGDVLETLPVTASTADIERVLQAFRGPIDQIPPMHSALKRNGVPLYKLARRGEVVERAPRRVIIRELSLIDVALPCFELDVLCSKGTYIRTLAEDIGQKLHCGAHLTALRRTGVGRFDLSGAHDLLAFEQAAVSGSIDALLQPVDTLVTNLPVVILNAAQCGRIRHGQTVESMVETMGTLSAGSSVDSTVDVRLPATGDQVRVCGARGEFIGIAEITATGGLKPVRLIAESGL